MIKDLQMLKDISLLFEKRLVLWGMGQKGREILADIFSMGAGKRGVLICDSDYRLHGKVILNNTVLSPEELNGKIQGMDQSDFAILVTVVSTKAQDEIIENIEKMCGKNIDIYTEFAVEWGIYLGLKNPNIDRAFKETELDKHKKSRACNAEAQKVREEALKYFAFLPLHNDEIVLVYQPGKVASSTVYKSILNRGRYVLHCHVLDEIGETDDSLYELLNMKSGKIICMVRDPVARRIAEMWQNMHQVSRYSENVDFAEIEKYYFPDNFDGGEFSWFNGQMKRVFKIDVFDYPFDQERGYSIIKKDNMEVLLLKMEKINELEGVIGGFLDIAGFKLDNSNIGEGKAYRFAYHDYKAGFSLSKDILEKVYINNVYTKHFYTEQETEEFYRKWQRG